MTKKNDLTFEAAITQLETIVTGLETGDINLEDALAQYKIGVELVKFCQEKLRDVEQKVKILDMESNQLKEFNAE